MANPLFRNNNSQINKSTSMKVLRIFGIVAAVHALALLLLLANPGCSTKPKVPPPSPAETVTAAPEQSPSDLVAPAPSTGGTATMLGTESPTGSSEQIHFSPTRPGTPASTALQQEPSAEVVPASTVMVTKGDSLWSLANKHHLSVADLAAANGLRTGSTLRLGQKLVVPSKALSPGALAEAETNSAEVRHTPATKAPANAVRHVVKAGESLGTIAKKYGVKVGDIAVANNITNPALIRAGRELIVPGWQTPKASVKVSATKSNSTPSAQEPPSMEPVSSAPVSEQKNYAPVMPKIGLPGPGEDLDAGLAPSGTPAPVPVIAIEEQPGQ